MPKDLMLILEDRPGTLADAAQALGSAGVSIRGACGFPSGGKGVLHVLVDDAAAARRALEAAGLEVQEERDVVVLGQLPPQPGTIGAVLRRIADRGLNVNLIYDTEEGGTVLGGDDVEGIRAATGS